MKKLCTVTSTLKQCKGDIDVVLWQHGDAFPELGASVGVDTETELITDTCLAPKLVVLGVFDAEHMTSYIVYWKDACEFMQELNRRDIEQRYFNVGFDEQVLDNEDPDKTLLGAVDRGNVRDMLVRVTMHDIANYGYKRSTCSNLAGCCKHILNYHLDKGDGTEASARLSFRRYNADGSDYTITDEQARYLPFDCITTWALGKEIDPEPTEVTHTKGMIVLAHISANGFPVDSRIYDALVSDLDECKADMRSKLVASGYPDPCRNEVNERRSQEKALADAYAAFMSACGIDAGNPFCARDGAGPCIYIPPCRQTIRRMLCYMYKAAGEPSEARLLEKCIRKIAEGDKTAKPLRKAEQKVWSELVEKYELMAFDETSKQQPLLQLCLTLLENLTRQRLSGKPETEGYSFDDGITEAGGIIDEHPEWLTGEKPIGPKKYFNAHVRDLLLDNGTVSRAEILEKVDAARKAAEERGVAFTETAELEEIIKYSKLKLDTTEKSGDPKLTKQDMWRLADLGIKDPFLEYQTTYNHADKYLSTYMKKDYIKSDGKVHPRFQVLVRTGRTSCTSPNIQNYPSRDKQFALKNMFYAGDGMILCSTDYSFLELCSFAQSCYTRFGFSVMKDVINSGIDPHYWFAGIMKGVIDADLSRKDDPQWVAQITETLHASVTKQDRQGAKFANFGLPGGLSDDSFFFYCRAGGLECTKKEAIRIRGTWMKTFTEIDKHMAVDQYEIPYVYKLKNPKATIQYAGLQVDPDDAIDNDDKGYNGIRYNVATITGFRRAACTKTSGANLQFQSTAGEGAKLAGWALLRAGLGDRIVDFIHDEYVYALYPHEVRRVVPEVERIMKDGMRQILPDINVGVSSSLALHWDKGSVEPPDMFSTVVDKDGNVLLDWDADGCPILKEPHYVAEVLARGSGK